MNRALSSGNSCLYGLCHAAIVAMGFSPTLGFVHTGKMLSFVYDVADLYKTETTIPLAFDVAASGTPNVEREMRLRCRDLFKEKRLLERVAKDLLGLFEAGDAPDEASFDDDPACPGGLWDEFGGTVAGGVSHGLAATEGE